MSIQRIRRELYGVQQAYQVIRDVWAFVKPWLQAGHRLHLEVRADTRSLAQNRIMWSVLDDLSKQVDWYGRKLSDWDWKDVLTASLRKQDAVPNLDGTGFVVLGQRTSEMTIAEMCDVITVGHAFGDGKGVKWKRTSLGRDVPDEVTARDQEAREPA
jgi:hypothetical protein